MLRPVVSRRIPPSTHRPDLTIAPLITTTEKYMPTSGTPPVPTSPHHRKLAPCCDPDVEGKLWAPVFSPNFVGTEMERPWFDGWQVHVTRMTVHHLHSRCCVTVRDLDLDLDLIGESAVARPSARPTDLDLASWRAFLSLAKLASCKMWRVEGGIRNED